MVVVECILYFYGVLMGLSVTHSIISSWHDCVDCNLITAWTKDSRAVFEIKERHSNHQLFSTILEQRRKAGSASVCYLFSKYLMAQTKTSPRRWCNVCADSPAYRELFRVKGVFTGRWTSSPLFTHTHTHTWARAWEESVFCCLRRERRPPLKHSRLISGGHKAHASFKSTCLWLLETYSVVQIKYMHHVINTLEIPKLFSQLNLSELNIRF